MDNTYDKHEKIRIFMDLFNGRKDVFGRFWQNNTTGKSGYAPAKDDNGTFLQLTETIIATRLAGQQLISIYPLLQNKYQSLHGD